jgi:SAM-dependent methyltransferase
VEFVLGNMRTFDLGRSFSLVIVSCNSFAHLTANEDIVDCLSRIARHLVPGGLLAFDVVPKYAPSCPMRAYN